MHQTRSTELLSVVSLNIQQQLISNVVVCRSAVESDEIKAIGDDDIVDGNWVDSTMEKIKRSDWLEQNVNSALTSKRLLPNAWLQSHSFSFDNNCFSTVSRNSFTNWQWTSHPNLLYSQTIITWELQKYFKYFEICSRSMLLRLEHMMIWSLKVRLQVDKCNKS